LSKRASEPVAEPIFWVFRQSLISPANLRCFTAHRTTPMAAHRSRSAVCDVGKTLPF